MASYNSNYHLFIYLKVKSNMPLRTRFTRRVNLFLFFSRCIMLYIAVIDAFFWCIHLIIFCMFSVSVGNISFALPQVPLLVDFLRYNYFPLILIPPAL